ncbi:hypothetical protein C1I60_14310 [Paenibacillus terrae]|uniref:Uncharacterized protein n=1 Tax=Paenibacillus terrae TaxID=159743 RepID=A0A4U2PUS0_9BACL|nr:hypothetical protein [Paenibacillus terrae]TKH43462.1 hypothetical protein C1I60_14310 [Paenibacillus terrae]
MTPFMLRDALVKELERLFADSTYLNARAELSKLNIYAQNLPAKSQEDDDDHYPFILVRVGDVVDVSDTENSTCAIMLSVGIVDEGLDMRGEDTILNITQRIRQHFLTNRTLDKQFILEPQLTCSLFDEENLWPYFFGYVDMSWIIPAIREGVQFDY